MVKWDNLVEGRLPYTLEGLNDAIQNILRSGELHSPVQALRYPGSYWPVAIAYADVDDGYVIFSSLDYSRSPRMLKMAHHTFSKRAAYKKAYRGRNKEERRTYLQDYQEKNKEKIAAYKRDYQEKNKERLRAYKKAYYEQNREEI
ncbi:unnamed protein product, partial [marine sediment metagenome]